MEVIRSADPQADGGELKAEAARRRPCPTRDIRRATGSHAQSFGTGTEIAGTSVPPSTWKILPVTQPPAGDAR